MKYVLPLVALVLGLAGGYFLNSKSSESVESGQKITQSGSRFENVEQVGARELMTDAELEQVIAKEAVGGEPWLSALAEADEFDQLGLIYSRLRHAQSGDFELILEQLDGDGASSMSWAVRRLINMRWAEVDPYGMLAYINEQPERSRWGLQSSLFAPWSKVDFNAAMQAARELPNRNMRRHAVNSIVTELAETQPMQAIQVASEVLGESNHSQWVYQNIFQRWSSRDPEAARAYALSLDEGILKTAALQGALSEWAGRDPMAALHWLDSLPADSSTNSSRKQVFRKLLNSDFETAREFIASQTDPLARREILESLYIQNLSWNKSYEEIQAVVDWIGEVTTGQLYDRKIQDAVRALADLDMTQAKDFALNMRPGNGRLSALGAIASKLAEVDPKAALDFALSLEFEDERERALSNMGWQMSRNSLKQSSELIAQSKDPLVQNRLATQIAREWADFDHAGALAWSERLTEENARKNAVQEVFKRWIQSDPESAMRYAENDVPSEERGSLYQRGFYEWARQDPGMAVDWLGQLPEDIEENHRDRIYDQVASAYVKHDPLAASEWIAGMDEGPARDSSVQSLVNQISRTDPEAAFLWAETVGDADARKNSLNRSIREWIKYDKDAAYEAVVDSKMSAEEKKPLLDMIKPNHSS